MAMLSYYSDTSSTIWSTDGYNQVAFSQKEDADPNTHTKKLLDCSWLSKATKLRTRAESPVIGDKEG